MYVCVYVCISLAVAWEDTPNLPTYIVDFRWNSHVHREFTGKFESSDVSRDNANREIGRIWGFSNNFRSYNFRKALNLKQRTLNSPSLARCDLRVQRVLLLELLFVKV